MAIGSVDQEKWEGTDENDADTKQQAETKWTTIARTQG